MHPNITKIIDQYLAGELNEEDTRVFEERLESNPELKAELELQKSVQEGAKRSAQRQTVRKIGKKYHLNQFLKWSGLTLGITALITTITIYSLNSSADEKLPPLEQEFIEQLDKSAMIDDLKTQYFQISEEGDVVLSKDGVLLSVPKNAFLLNGKPYSGKTIVQFQEAAKGIDIIKSGLSTMSGDKLLETQGMFGVQGFTEKGEPLEFNPEVGVYVQLPTNENGKNMQLFDGVKQSNGVIDWQNPVPLEKIPVPVDMGELDFYPAEYEPYLDAAKWKKSKKSRDSLYLSFENYFAIDTIGIALESIGGIPYRKITREERDYLYGDNRPIDKIMTEKEAYRLAQWTEGPNWESDFNRFMRDTIFISQDEIESAPPFILPSSVLAFWKPKFNNTNLATREFERRMRVIHETCDNAVLAKYLKNLNKPISTTDREVVAMGYSEFERFAAENVGALNPDNPHLKGLQAFYEKGISALKKRAKREREEELKRQNKWDAKMNDERIKEQNRTADRNATALDEEYKFNLKNVKKQLGNTTGFTLKHGGGTIKNVDAYVMEATIARKTTVITDPYTGKTAKITYNDFSFTVPNSEKYIKLYAYIFPHQLNSYQRIEGKKGNFNYPLNDDILYDMGIVGITEDGYEYFQKQTFKGGELGEITMRTVTESQLEASIQQLNKKRISKPMKIQEELDWLIDERTDYKEQKMRKEMNVFRAELACRISTCLCMGEINDATGITVLQPQ